MMDAPRIAGAIFDLDGTIADTFAICFATFRNALACVQGPSMTDAEIQALFGPSEDGMFERVVPARVQRAVPAPAARPTAGLRRGTGTSLGGGASMTEARRFLQLAVLHFLGLLTGVWIFISPWVLGYPDVVRSWSHSTWTSVWSLARPSRIQTPI